MDVLRLQAMGLDRPRACSDPALVGRPAMPTPGLARGVRQAA